jgi:hypothetical protein
MRSEEVTPRRVRVRSRSIERWSADIPKRRVVYCTMLGRLYAELNFSSGELNKFKHYVALYEQLLINSHAAKNLHLKGYVLAPAT